MWAYLVRELEDFVADYDKDGNLEWSSVSQSDGLSWQTAVQLCEEGNKGFNSMERCFWQHIDKVEPALVNILQVLADDLPSFVEHLNHVHMYFSKRDREMGQWFTVDKVSPKEMHVSITNCSDTKEAICMISIIKMAAVMILDMPGGVNVGLLEPKGADSAAGKETQTLKITCSSDDECFSAAMDRKLNFSSEAAGGMYMVDKVDFYKLYPFHVVLDTQGKLLQVGSQLRCRYPGMTQPNANLNQFFTIHGPTWDSNGSFKQLVESDIPACPFVLGDVNGSLSLTGVFSRGVSVQDSGKDEVRNGSDGNDGDILIFIGYPCLNSPGDMEQNELKLSHLAALNQQSDLLVQVGQVQQCMHDQSMVIQDLEQSLVEATADLEGLQSAVNFLLEAPPRSSHSDSPNQDMVVNKCLNIFKLLITSGPSAVSLQELASAHRALSELYSSSSVRGHTRPPASPPFPAMTTLPAVVPPYGAMLDSRALGSNVRGVGDASSFMQDEVQQSLAQLLLGRNAYELDESMENSMLMDPIEEIAEDRSVAQESILNPIMQIGDPGVESPSQGSTAEGFLDLTRSPMHSGVGMGDEMNTNSRSNLSTNGLLSVPVPRLRANHLRGTSSEMDRVVPRRMCGSTYIPGQYPPPGLMLGGEVVRDLEHDDDAELQSFKSAMRAIGTRSSGGLQQLPVGPSPPAAPHRAMSSVASGSTPSNRKQRSVIKRMVSAVSVMLKPTKSKIQNSTSSTSLSALPKRTKSASSLKPASSLQTPMRLQDQITTPIRTPSKIWRFVGRNLSGRERNNIAGEQAAEPEQEKSVSGEAPSSRTSRAHSAPPPRFFHDRATGEASQGNEGSSKSQSRNSSAFDYESRIMDTEPADHRGRRARNRSFLSVASGAIPSPEISAADVPAVLSPLLIPSGAAAPLVTSPVPSVHTGATDYSGLKAAASAAAAVSIASGRVEDQFPGKRLQMILYRPSDELAKVLETVEDWNFDAFALDRASSGRPLSLLAFMLFKRHFVSRFHIDETKLAHYLYRIEDGYSNNPYHCRIHAADVLHTLHVTATRCGLFQATLNSANPNDDAHLDSSALTSVWNSTRSQSSNIVTSSLSMRDLLTLLTSYLAAVIHDYDHRGVNNQFLIMTGDPLALRYNDISPMENHHVSAAFCLLREDRYNFLCKLPPKVYHVLRARVIDLVLSTDMKQHFSTVAMFNQKFGRTVEAADLSADQWAHKNLLQSRETSASWLVNSRTYQGMSQAQLMTLSSSNTEPSIGSNPGAPPTSRPSPCLYDPLSLQPGTIVQPTVTGDDGNMAHMVALKISARLGERLHCLKRNMAHASHLRTRIPSQPCSSQINFTAQKNSVNFASGNFENVRETLPAKLLSNLSSNRPSSHDPSLGVENLMDARLGLKELPTRSSPDGDSAEEQEGDLLRLSPQLKPINVGNRSSRDSGESGKAHVNSPSRMLSTGCHTSSFSATTSPASLKHRVMHSPSARSASNFSSSLNPMHGTHISPSQSQLSMPKLDRHISSPAPGSVNAMPPNSGSTFSNSTQPPAMPRSSAHVNEGRIDSRLDVESRLLLWKMTLKCADLGHLTGNPEVHCKWVERLEEEMFRQGDREKSAGLPVSPLMDRDKSGITASQTGFFNVVAIPMYTALTTALPSATPLLIGLKENHNMWQMRENASREAAEAVEKGKQ